MTLQSTSASRHVRETGTGYAIISAWWTRNSVEQFSRYVGVRGRLGDRSPEDRVIQVAGERAGLDLLPRIRRLHDDLHHADPPLWAAESVAEIGRRAKVGSVRITPNSLRKRSGLWPTSSPSTGSKHLRSGIWWTLRASGSRHYKATLARFDESGEIRQSDARTRLVVFGRDRVGNAVMHDDDFGPAVHVD